MKNSRPLHPLIPPSGSRRRGLRSVPSASDTHKKRALWEVRQRYRIDKTALPTRPPTTRPAAPVRARVTSPVPRRRMFGRIILLIVVGLLTASGIFSFKVLSAGNKMSVTERSIIGQLKDLLFSSGQHLKGEPDDRINVLLLAVGGEGHKGEELADTIMVASIRPSDRAVALLSIPRDLYVQVPNESYYSKINAVHAYGESQKKDSGPELLRQKVEEMTGTPIHYYSRVDFTAFKHLVDAVGGVDISIENSFYDYWHKISFPAGTERMNGERALAYVRARYIEGPEGGDFKRAARQQQVLLALRQKLFSVQTAFDFGAINGTLNSLSNNIRTDLELWEMRRFYELMRDVDQNKVHNVVLTTGHNGVLTGSTEVLGGAPASVLKTRTGDYSEIQSLAGQIFSAATAESREGVPPAETPELAASPEATPTLPPATVEIRNGTNTAGLAATTKEKLVKEGYTVNAIGNAGNRATAKTTVYALQLSQADTAKKVAGLLEAPSDSGLPEGETPSSADILVILGADAS